MAGDDSQGDAGTADTGRFPRPGSEPAQEGEVEVTGRFTAHDFKAVEDTAVRRATDEPPPSMGIIATGVFPVPSKAPEDDMRSAATVESTRIEPPPEGAREAHLRRAHAVTEPTLEPSLEKTLDPAYLSTQPPRRSGTSSHRPLDPPPDDPTRPPSLPPVQPAEGGVVLPLLFAAACLVGIAFLVRSAFPELFARFTGGAAPVVRLEKPGSGWLDGPVVVAGKVENPGRATALAWKVEAPADLAGVAGVTTLAQDGRFSFDLGAAREGTSELRLAFELGSGDALVRLADARPLNVDRAAPVVRLVSPAEAATVGSDTALELRVADASPITLSAWLDGKVLVKPTPLARDGADWTLRAPLAPALTKGTHTLKVVAEDALGRPTTLERAFTVGDAPTSTTEKPPGTEKPPATEKPSTGERPGLPPAPRVLLAWPAGAQVGPGPLEVKVEGADEVELLLDGARWSAPPIELVRGKLADGPHTLEVRATSKGGSARERRRFVFDATPPAIDVEAVATGLGPVKVTGKVTDELDRSPRATLSIDGGPPAPLPALPHQLRLSLGAEHRFEVVARDAAGNEARKTLTVVTVPDAPLKPPPPVTEPKPSTEPKPGTEPKPPVTETETPPVVIKKPPPVVTEPPPPVKDTTSPTIFVVDPSVRVFMGAADLAVRVTDAGGPVRVVARLSSGRDAPLAQEGDVWRAKLELPPGDHELTFVATDAAGNESRAVRQFRIDTTTTAPAPNTVKIPSRSGTRLRIEGQIAAGSSVTLDGNGQRLATGKALPLVASVGAGAWSVQVTVTSATGERSTWRGNVEVDATPPVLTGVRVVPGANGRARVEGQARDVGTVTVQVLVDGTPAADTLPCELDLPPSGSADIVVIGTDDVGNQSRVTRRVESLKAPVTERPPVPAGPWLTSEDPREAQAVQLAGQGKSQEAIALIDEMLRDRRLQSKPSLYWHRGHAREAIADALEPGTARTQWLNQALNDATRVLTLAEERSTFRRYKGDLLTKLGRRTLAAEEYARADVLAADGR